MKRETRALDSYLQVCEPFKKWLSSVCHPKYCANCSNFVNYWHIKWYSFSLRFLSCFENRWHSVNMWCNIHIVSKLEKNSLKTLSRLVLFSELTFSFPSIPGRDVLFLLWFLPVQVSVLHSVFSWSNLMRWEKKKNMTRPFGRYCYNLVPKAISTFKMALGTRLLLIRLYSTGAVVKVQWDPESVGEGDDMNTLVLFLPLQVLNTNSTVVRGAV